MQSGLSPACVPLGDHPELRAIFLVGFMGAGKTSVGKALSARLSWPFEDLDDRIQAREGRSVEAIFRESGEGGFRRAEHLALCEVISELGPSPRVVALGGGAFVQRENSDLLQQAGLATIFLDGPPEELFRRCGAEAASRPLRRDFEQFRQLYEARRVAYSNRTIRIDTAGKDIQTVSAEAASALGLG
jgi:shikimate kinase